MADYLKAVENQTNGFIQKRNTYLSPSGTSINILNGNKLTFTLADRTDLVNRPWGNLFSTFKLPITPTQIDKYATGIFSNTAFKDLNVDRIIAIDIPKNEYGELVTGNSIELNIPILSGGTQVNYQIRSVYFLPEVSSTATRTRELMDAPLFLSDLEEGVVSERNLAASEHGDTNKTDSIKESNVVYLFSDLVAPPLEGGSWHTGTTYNATAPVSLRRSLATYQNGANTGDTPVGIAYLDKGFIALTHPTLVDNFPWSATTTTKLDSFEAAFFTGSTTATTNLTFTSFVTEFTQTVVCVLNPNEFFTSDNETYTEVMESNGESVQITELAFYNADGELIAIGKPSKPIPKNRNNLVAFTVEIKI